MLQKLHFLAAQPHELKKKAIKSKKESMHVLIFMHAT
jgi:hypothetical protein